jgi:hypothetical protein
MIKTPPSKAEISVLEPFVGLMLECIHVPSNITEFAAATADIMSAGMVGFDTESKPTFAVGDVSEGPHVVQFAHQSESHPFLLELLQSAQLIKVGFGLKSDRSHIFNKLGIRLNGVVDLNTLFSMDGYKKEMGVRTAVALVFNQRFAKSRKITTSNWAQLQLTPQQMLYAANDAYAALKVLLALNRPRDELPIIV